MVGSQSPELNVKSPTVEPPTVHGHRKGLLSVTQHHCDPHGWPLTLRRRFSLAHLSTRTWTAGPSYLASEGKRGCMSLLAAPRGTAVFRGLIVPSPPPNTHTHTHAFPSPQAVEEEGEGVCYRRLSHDCLSSPLALTRHCPTSVGQNVQLL